MNDDVLERLVKPSGETAEVNAMQQPCAAAQLEEPDLSTINFAANLVASTNAEISVGQRINSRQATAIRVSFDDPLVNNLDFTVLSDKLNVGSWPSDPLNISHFTGSAETN
jgi:hypothetical protein